MRVAELIEKRRFRLVEGPVGEPGPGQVQVKVRAVGICGSDLQSFSEGCVGDTPNVYPMVLGHESAATVVKAGVGVSGWAPGDKVVLEPAIYCHHCEYCISGHHNVCANLRFLSQPGDPGFLRDYVNLPARNVLPLPAGLSFQEGTLFEPLAVVLHGMKFAELRLGETAAVFGAGPIGLLTIAALRLAGASRVWTVEPVAARRDLALQLGADSAIDPQAADPRRTVLNDTGGRGVDVAVDCATRGGSLNHSIHVTRNAGRVVVIGIPREARVSLDYHLLRRKELVFLNVRRSNHESEAALQLLRDHPRRFTPMLTHFPPIEQVQPAFEMLEAYQDGVGKLVLDLG